jgi:hypothetical protein
MPPHQLNPAQLAVQAQRRAAKEAKKRAAEATALMADNGSTEASSPTVKFLKREWIPLEGTQSREFDGRSARILCWNVSFMG